MRNMHVWPYFVSDQAVWFSDLCAGGLYTYDRVSEEICCKIKPDSLFHFGIFEVSTLSYWKSKVFVFSEKLNGLHIVYDSLKNKIKRLKGLENELPDLIHQAIIINETLYLLPKKMRGYIYAIDLAVWNESDDSIRVLSRRVGKNITIKTWMPKKCGQSLYIPEHGGKRIFCITDDKVDVISLDIPFDIFAVSVFEEELWVAPLNGRHIYCLTLDGKIKESVEILNNHVDERKNLIWEIVLKDEYVFFLHWQEPEIDIYNKKNKKIFRINARGFELPSRGGPGDEQCYLPYVLETDIIRFFPSRYSMLEIDLTDLVHRRKKFEVPQQISKKEWINACRLMRKYRYSQKVLLNEKKGDGLGEFKEYILENSLQEYVTSQEIGMGKIIYKYVS